MHFKIFRNELRRNKVINMTLFTFIMLAALLAACAASVITMLMDSVDMLMEACATPHFVQMHAGEVNNEQLAEYNNVFDYIEDFMAAETIPIDGANIAFNDSIKSESDSVMDISFVMQNENFDYLLDTSNQIVHMKAGNIAVPLYYKNQKDLNIGDTLTVSIGDYEKVFTISAFVRDSQMNPSLVSSKRFVVSDNDYTQLAKKYTEREYLIEYRFDSLDRIDEFTASYTASDMPQVGPAVDYTLFRMLNAITDGIIVLVLILVSVLLIVIGLLCLWFTLLGAIEEDTSEIGVMKAIGLPLKNIKYLYMSKYVLLSSAACVMGYLLSFWINGLFTKNIAENMGAAEPKADTYLFTAISAGLVFLLVVVSCYCLLSRFKKLSAVKALTSQLGVNNKQRNRLSLKKNILSNTNIFMGINAVFSNVRTYLLLGIIFIISTFIIIVPVNLLNTFNSSEFINYMGVGSSHLRIDLRTEAKDENASRELIEYIENDDRIKEFGVYKTYRAGIVNSDGEMESVPLEIGDFSLFPLNYSEGYAPINENEIALSVLTAESIEKGVGDIIEIECGNSQYQVTISGIYQDITNGGKTAKANIAEPNADTLWYVINANVVEYKDAQDKADEYSAKFAGVKVTHLEEYLHQTLGSTISQLRLVTIFAVVISMFIASLISLLI